MRIWFTKRGVGCFVAFAAIVSAVPCFAQFPVGQFDGTPIQAPGSPINLMRVFSVQLNPFWPQGEIPKPVVAICVTFKNLSDRKIARAQFVVERFDSAGNLLGDIDTLNDHNIIQPGAIEGGDKEQKNGIIGAVASFAQNCIGWNGGAMDGENRLYYRKNFSIFASAAGTFVTKLEASLQEIDYTDGSSWTPSFIPSQSLSPSPAPSSSP